MAMGVAVELDTVKVELAVAVDVSETGFWPNEHVGAGVPPPETLHERETLPV